MNPTLSTAYHEAAHAVTAEYLRPGSISGASIGRQDVTTMHGALRTDCIGSTWYYDVLSDEQKAIMLCASRPGEELIDPSPDPLWFFGDEWDLRYLGFAGKKLDLAQRQAREIVVRSKAVVGRVAEALYERKKLTGDEIRGLMLEVAK